MDEQQNAVASSPTVEDARLLGVIEHCEAALRTAEDLGQTFLAYLLAMAAQEARIILRTKR